LYRKRDNQMLLRRCYEARSFWSRLQGLLGVKSIQAGEGLLIVPCRSVHTFFMQFPIDVCFLSPDGVVVHLIPNLKPFRLTGLVWGASMTLEASVGWIRDHQVREGDQLELRERVHG
jgi:uncharacterized membrane protein (UPF0127 family)